MLNIKKFLSLPHSKKIIVGLDYTLWPFKAEYKHFLYSEIYSYNQPHINRFFKEINNENLKLYATSRSVCPELSQIVLKLVYPDIKFNKVEIFNTKKPDKLPHISNIIKDINEPFTVFDSDDIILNGIKKVYTNCEIYRTPESFDLFK